MINKIVNYKCKLKCKQENKCAPKEQLNISRPTYYKQFVFVYLHCNYLLIIQMFVHTYTMKKKQRPTVHYSNQVCFSLPVLPGKFYFLTNLEAPAELWETVV